MVLAARKSVAKKKAAKASPNFARLKPGGFLLVVSGPSGVGKGTLVASLMEQRKDCVFSVSATTRAPRGKEKNGREYWFLGEKDFRAKTKQGWFLEYAKVFGNLYGTPNHEVEGKIKKGKVVVLDIDVQGGASVRRKRPDAVSVFIAPPSFAELKRRLVGRKTDSAEAIARRLATSAIELPQYVHYDYLIVNDDLEAAKAQLIAIHDIERRRIERLSK